MRAEIIAVGTEILLGEIVNTNAQFAAQKLAQLGITAHYQTVVGDNPSRIEAAMQIAEKRSEILILIGGLGPTPDDLTKTTVAHYLQLKLATDSQTAAKIAARQQRIQRQLPANSQAQADYFVDGEVLANTVGLACGSYVHQNHHDYFVLPGPPREFRPMFQNEVLPRLTQLIGQKQVIQSEMIRSFGWGESEVVRRLQPLLDEQTNPTLAIYLKGYEIGVRVTARAQTTAEAQALITPQIAELKRLLAPVYTGMGESRTLANEVVDLLSTKHLHVTAAESLTAGLFQATLANIAGASEIFSGGFVTYSNQVKSQLLGIDSALIKAKGVVSAEVAQAMAEKSREKLSADFGLGFTGVAGPDSLEGQPVGTVYIALAQKHKPTLSREFHLGGPRNEVRQRAVLCGLKLLYDRLQQ